MATKPFATPNNFASEGSGTTNNIPLLDANFTALQSYNNDGSFFTMQGTDAGSTNIYVVTMASGYVPSAYNKGTLLYFYPANSNTGPSTININGVGTVNIRKNDTSALVGGEIQAGRLCGIVYDGTQFVIPLGSTSGSVATSYYAYDDLISFPYSVNFTTFGSVILSFGQSGNGGCIPYNGPASGIVGHPGVVTMNCGTATGNTTNATVNNASAIFLDAFTYTIRSIIKTETTLTTNAVFLGFTDFISIPIGTNQHYVGFNGSSASGFWTMVSCNGTVSQSNTATTAAIASNTWYDLMIVVSSSLATFYVNGTQVGTLSTTLPSTTVLMNIGLSWGANSGTNKQMYMDTFELLVSGIPQLGTNPRFLHGMI